MIFDLGKLIAKYGMEITGVIHIGANTGGEYHTYKKLGIDDMIFFEPHPEAFEILRKTVYDQTVYNFALGSEPGMAEMYVSDNRWQSSTLLKPKEHLNLYPQVKFTNKITVHVLPLDDFDILGCNFISIDAEGYEMEVFKGAKETLQGVDYIICEVAKVYLQEGRPLVGEIDEFLCDFTRVETDWAGGVWGDALYIR